MNALILPNAQLQVWCSMPAHNHSFQVSNQLLIPNSSPGPSRGYFFLPITLPNATSKPPFTLQVHPSPFTFTPRSKPHLALVHNLPEPKPNPGLDLYKIVVRHQSFNLHLAPSHCGGLLQIASHSFLILYCPGNQTLLLKTPIMSWSCWTQALHW